MYISIWHVSETGDYVTDLDRPEMNSSLAKKVWGSAAELVIVMVIYMPMWINRIDNPCIVKIEKYQPEV